MEWTIEKVRELPADNWLGIRRVGAHAWQIGNKDMMLVTGDGGVLEYLKVFEKTTQEPLGLIELIEKEGNKPTYLPGTITYRELKELISKMLNDGMDKT